MEGFNGDFDLRPVFLEKVFGFILDPLTGADSFDGDLCFTLD